MRLGGGLAQRGARYFGVFCRAWFDCLVVTELLALGTEGFIAWEFELFIHRGLTELLLDLGLEDVQLVLHVPIDVGEALLGRVVVRMLSLFVSERGYHPFVELFYLRGRVLAALIGWRAFRAHFPNAQVLQFLLRGRCPLLLLLGCLFRAGADQMGFRRGDLLSRLLLGC